MGEEDICARMKSTESDVEDLNNKVHIKIGELLTENEGLLLSLDPP